MDKYIDKLTELVLEYGPKLIGAIIVLVIGLQIIKLITKAISKMLDKKNTDPSLSSFLKSLTSILLKLMLVISVMGMAGIEMTSFIAVLGAAGLAVGMALSGTLQNFAGGVMLLIFKPFKVGDYIEAQGYAGIVSEIQLFNTIIKTLDNKVVIIPNGGLSSSSMVNYSAEELRRVDWTFGIAYGDDVDKAKAVIRKLIEADDRILKEPEPFTAVSELADSSVNFVVRVWVKNEDYWGVFFDMNEAVYKTFDKEGLNIPYPQMDVHIQNN
ncbi:MAG: mechanosensitive ion channel [Chlorobi bacterium]|nr:mechanosensitive ion channel [Chlorobiota bacterium]